MKRTTAEFKYVAAILCSCLYSSYIDKVGNFAHYRKEPLSIQNACDFKYYTTCYRTGGCALIPSFPPLKPDRGHSFAAVVGNGA